MAMAASVHVECEAVWGLPTGVGAFVLGTKFSNTEVVLWMGHRTASIQITGLVR